MTAGTSDFKGLGDGFIEAVRNFPDRPALEVTGQTLSYEKLFESAASIAATLQQQASYANTPLAAVLAHRSWSAFAGILGTLISGQGYVPLNPNFPAERSAMMLQRSEATSIIVGSESLDSLRELLPKLDKSLLVILPDLHDSGELQSEFSEHTFVSADELQPSSSWKRRIADPEEIAYLLFTSGSTGQPKGVPIKHRNIRFFIDTVTARYQIREFDRLSQMFELVFDLSIFDMFATWESGACLCCPSIEEVQIPARYVKDSRISVWFSVPSLAIHMKQMRMLRANAFPNLRLSLFCGEALLADTLKSWATAAPNSTIENIYGPTEVTLACTGYLWDAESSPSECNQGLVPIGRPFPGLEFMVVDEDLNEVSDGGSGELLMSGPQVAHGYFRDEEKTRAAFVVPPGKQKVFYRTGDLVTKPKGNGPINYLGRLDHQIKIRGNRVELGEIEAIVRDVANVEIAVAIGWPVTSSGADAIIVFLQGTPADHKPIQIRDDLVKRLPAHMIPKDIRFISQMPLNSSGKIDRNAIRQILLQETDTKPLGKPEPNKRNVAAKNNQNGIVVLGCPRSGTTLIRRMLDAHPNIACPGETCILSAAARFLHSEIVSDGLEFGVLNGLAFAGCEPKTTLGKLREFAFSFHEDFARAQNKRRWAEKTAVDVFHLSEIEKICDDHVQYVCVVRHGLDVACSIREFSDRGHTFLSEIHEYVRKHPRPLEAFAHAWVDATESILEFQARHTSNAMLIHYEDLVSDPEKEARRLFEYLGEDWRDDILQNTLESSTGLGMGDWKAHSTTSIDTTSVNRWRSLSPGVISRLAEICNPTLEKCGYNSVRVQPPQDQAEARRRYKLALAVGLGQSENKLDQ